MECVGRGWGWGPSRQCWQEGSSAPQALAPSLPPFSPSQDDLQLVSPWTSPWTSGTPRLRTAYHGFYTNSLLSKKIQGASHSDRWPPLCSATCSAGVLLLLGTRSQAPLLCKLSAPSPGPRLQHQTAHAHASSGFCSYTEVSGNSSISSNAFRVVLLLLLEESWILVRSAFKKNQNRYFRKVVLCNTGFQVPMHHLILFSAPDF